MSTPTPPPPPPKLTRDEALAALVKAQQNNDPEDAHADADYILLGLIDDQEITDAWEKVRKWYA